MSRISNNYLNNIDLGPPASLAKSNLQLPLLAVEDGKITMKYILTAENVVVIFVKALLKLKFTEFVGMLGLVIMKE